MLSVHVGTSRDFGSSLAHAATNVLAGLRFRKFQGLVLTTTLEPCLQCAAAIRLGPVSTVRFAGEDRYWEVATTSRSCRHVRPPGCR